MAKQEVYKSTTLGSIPLSFTGRHLLQSLREALEDAIAAKDASVNWDALSRVRGRLARYMSGLEKKDTPDFEPSIRNEYRVTYTGAEQTSCGLLVTKGSCDCLASNMDLALTMAVQVTRSRGHIVKRTDFSVRLLQENV